MKLRSSRRTIFDLAEQAGAETYSGWPRRIGGTLLKQWQARRPTAKSGLVMVAGQNAPRDLDDPFSDWKVQARVGEFIAKQATRPGRGR